VTPAQIRYSVRRLRRKVPDTFILVTMAGAADVDGKSLFPSGERGTLVQESLVETAMTIKSIAVSSGTHKETNLNTTSDTPAGQTPSPFTPKDHPELQAI
jgi:hypothetical protein